MALPDSFVQQVGTQISFADHAGDFAATAKNNLEQGTPTDVQLSLANVADGAGRESAKVDLGASRASAYSVMACFEMAATPTTGEVVELYWAPSPDATAANGNVFDIDGVDAAAPSGVGTLAELVSAATFIGNFRCGAVATASVMTGFVGVLAPPERYGILIVKNESGAAFHSDDVESHIVFTPITDVVID